MSTIDVEKQQIKNLLGSLGEESLNRFHNSVNISFAQMLAYIESLHDPDWTEEIKSLLETYRLMAEKFYTQFELSLLSTIAEQRNTRELSAQVIGKIRDVGELENLEMETAIDILITAQDNADATYKDLLQRFPALLQEALDKLKTEWERLNTIAVSNRALNRDEQLLRALEAVVKAAAYSVGIEKDRIAIVPGNAFALYFFSYLDNLAVLTVPIHSVRAPWEWSIFWHELAGYKVRQLEGKSTIDKLRVKLKEFYDFYRGDEKRQERQELLDAMMRIKMDESEYAGRRRNRFGQKYLDTIFSRPRLVLSDLGSFEYQFEQVLKNLKMKNKFQTYDEIKDQGWCIDWFEELFEDAFSVIAIGEPFLDFFKDILSRHTSEDGRHPPLDIRLAVAKELLQLMNSENEPEDPTTVQESVAQQILKFTSLLTVASHPMVKRNDGVQPWLANIVRYDLPVVVGVKIGDSIQKWSERFLSAKDRISDAQEEAEAFVHLFSVDNLGVLSIVDREARSEITPSYETLLEGRDYQGLLALSFYERDFFSGLDVENVQILKKLQGVLPGWQSVFPQVVSTTIVDGLMGSSGDLRFTINKTTYKTTVINWNKVFPNGKYHIVS